MKTHRVLAVFLACTGGLFAQTADGVSHTVNFIPATTASAPAIQNILTVIGPAVTGLPCFSCVNGATPSLGIVSPAGTILEGSTYEINNLTIDNSYTGSCTFTLAIEDAAKKFIASAKGSFNEVPGSAILVSVSLTVPAKAGATGNGKATTIVQCGTSKTTSSSPVFITP